MVDEFIYYLQRHTQVWAPTALILVVALFYFASLALLAVVVESWDLPENHTPLLIIAVLTPASFVATRTIIIWQPDIHRHFSSRQVELPDFGAGP